MSFMLARATRSWRRNHEYRGASCHRQPSRLPLALAVALIAIHGAEKLAVFAQDGSLSALNIKLERLVTEVEALDKRGESAKADRLMQRVLDSSRSAFGGKHQIYMRFLFSHVMRLDERGDYETVRSLVSELVPLIEQHINEEGASDMLRNALCANITALRLERADELDAAKACLQRLEQLSTDIKPGDIGFMNIVLARGRVARTTRDATLIIANSRQQLAHRKAQDPESMATAYATSSLARDLCDFGGDAARAEASQLANEAFRRFGKLANANTLATWEGRLYMAETFIRLKQYDDAKAVIDQVLTTAVPFDPDCKSTDQTREVLSENWMACFNNLAINCRDAGQMQLAIPMFRFVLAKRLEKQPPDSVEVLRAQSGLGRSLMFAGQTREGMELISQAYETALKSPEKTASVIPALLLSRAVGLELTGDRDQARRTFEEALAKAINLEKDPQVAVQMRQLMAGAFADALDRSGHADEAASLRRQAKATEPDRASSGP